MGQERKTSAFTVPVDERYLEDYVPGRVCECGSVTVSEADIVAFATQFDPQPIHVDPDAARKGPFHGLIASGWHAASLMMRLLVDRYLSSVGSLGSPGVDELRWLAPVRPGNELRLRATVLESRRSRSKPDRGLVRTLAELINQDGVVTLRVTVLSLVKAHQDG